MKLLSLLAAGAAVLVSASGAYAATGTAEATATVATALTVTKQADLRFGAFVPSNSAGSVDSDPAGTITGVTALNSLPRGNATFLVTGNPTATYAVTVPTGISLTGPGTAMPVALTTNSVGPLDGTGSDIFGVPGTLTVNANQAPGAYSATFTVTVEYN